MKATIFLFLISMNLSALAQVPTLADRPLPIPEIDLNLNTTNVMKGSGLEWNELVRPNPPHLPQTNPVNRLANKLDLHFQQALAPLKYPAPTCKSEDSLAYIFALRLNGDFDECVRFARECAIESSPIDPLVLVEGAHCESTRYNYQNADELFDLATQTKFTENAHFAEAVFEYATFATFGIFEKKTESILKRNAEWSDNTWQLWLALINRFGESDLSPYSKNEVDVFLNQAIAKADTHFAMLLKSIRLHILYRDYKYSTAMEFALQEMDSFKNPLQVYFSLYQAFYFGLDQDFAEARAIYDVFDNYSNPWWTLPVESNTYNYSQIYSTICNESLLQAKPRLQFEKFKSEIRNGQISPEQSFLLAQKWNLDFPNKTDVLTLLASIYSLRGDHATAQSLYWQAHRLCRYYNRANWGLTLERRFAKYSQMPEYQDNSERVDIALKDIAMPADIAGYITNWNSLLEDVQKRVLYGGRIWLPFVNTLYADQLSAFIKSPYDLLSESPDLEKLKDARIGGVNYPNDNRLWDDVRGVGGNVVVADINEVFQTVQGDYNLLGHEMAHQFHRYIDKHNSSASDCIDRMYEMAKSNKNFPDAYSSYNKQEHFAQGVTYYLVPLGSPKRFGLNQNWVKTNNPTQFDFIKSIDESGGDHTQLRCSL